MAPASTMAVVRVKQNVLAESRAGFIATARRSPGPSGKLGARRGFHLPDVALPRRQELQRRRVGPRHGSRGPRLASATRTAFGFKVDYPNDLWDCCLIYRRIGDGFDPSLGFVPRRGINTYQAGCTYAPRPKGGLIRQMFHEFYPEPHHRPRRTLGELPGLHRPGQLAARERRPLRAQRRPGGRAAQRSRSRSSMASSSRPGPTTGFATGSRSRPRPSASCPARRPGGSAVSTRARSTRSSSRPPGRRRLS